MKIVIIGGVAAGTSAAAKARRNDEAAQITIFDADQDVSYSGCGLPYYIGTDIEEREQLVPRNAQFFKQKYNVDVLTGHQVLAIDSRAKTLMVENLATGQQFSDSYDKLIIATGAQAVRPPIAGSDKGNVFHLRNVVSADRIRQQVLAAKPETAVVVGSGFIGLEMAEILTARGIRVSVVEIAEHIMPALDADMAVYVADYLQQQGVELIVQAAVTHLEGTPLVNKVVLKSGRELAADLIILAAGVQPNVELACRAGVELGPTGAIQVNERMETNIEDIYACGDCAESYSLIIGKPFYRPLGSTANKMGRIAGDQASGGNLTFRGGLGTGIFKVFDLAVGQTGLTEKEAKREGYEAVVCHIIKPDKPEYFHGQEMVMKAVADRVSGSVLGAQVIGKAGVDKRLDVLVTAITFGTKAEDLFHLDLAYAPPFATTKDPVMYAGMVLTNALERQRGLITAAELKTKLEQGEAVQVIDARVDKQYQAGHVAGARNLPQERIREELATLNPATLTVTYCNKGVTGNATQNILINHSFQQVLNLSGGYSQYSREFTIKRDEDDRA